MLLRRSWKRSTKVTCHRYSHHLHYPHNHHHQHRSTFPPSQPPSRQCIRHPACLPTLDSGIFKFFFYMFERLPTSTNMFKCHQMSPSDSLCPVACEQGPVRLPVQPLQTQIFTCCWVASKDPDLLFYPSQSKAEQPHTTTIQNKKSSYRSTKNSDLMGEKD